MRKIKIYCKNCYKPFSNVVSEIDEKSLIRIDGEELLPDNSIIKTTDLEISLPENLDIFLSANSELNIEDHSDSKRFQGCCGPGDFSKLNQVCSNCKEEIAVLFADCWLYHFLVFDNTKIIVKDFTDKKHIRRIKL